MLKQSSETRSWNLTSNLTRRPNNSEHHESRNDHGNALIGKDRYSFWLQSYPVIKQKRTLHSISNEGSSLTIQKFINACQGLVMDACFSLFMHQWHRRKSFWTIKNGTATVVCKVAYTINGGTATCATCTTRWPMQDSVCYNTGVNIDEQPKSATSPSLRKARLHHFGHNYFPDFFGCVYRAGGGWSNARELVSLRHPRQTVQAPGSRTRRNVVFSMCRRISQILRCSSTSTRRNAARVTMSKIKKKKRRPYSKMKTVNTFGTWVVTLDIVITTHIEKRCTLWMKRPSPVQWNTSMSWGNGETCNR